jgi:hypothetical protein
VVSLMNYRLIFHNNLTCSYRDGAPTFLLGSSASSHPHSWLIQAIPKHQLWMHRGLWTHLKCKMDNVRCFFSM